MASAKNIQKQRQFLAINSHQQPSKLDNPRFTDFVPSTLWIFNIAMENGPFIDGLPINSMVIFRGYVSHNQMVPQIGLRQISPKSLGPKSGLKCWHLLFQSLKGGYESPCGVIDYQHQPHFHYISIASVESAVIRISVGPKQVWNPWNPWMPNSVTVGSTVCWAPCHLSVSGDAVALVHFRPSQRCWKGGEVDGHLRPENPEDPQLKRHGHCIDLFCFLGRCS